MCKIVNRLYSAAVRLFGATRQFNAARLFGAMLLGCAVLFSGCVKEDDPFGEKKNVVVQLSVDSRANIETDGTPNDAENKLHTLRVYAFVGGRLAGHYYTDNVTMLNGKHTFYMDLTFYSVGDQAVDFYAVANEGAMNLKRAPMSSEDAGPDMKLDETTAEEVISSVWFNNYLRPNLETKGLPMCSKQSVTLNFTDIGTETAPAGSGHEGHTLLNQTIEFSLERPTAKIGVFAAKPAGESSKLYVTKLEMLAEGVCVRNYLMKQNDETLQAVLHGGRDVNIDVVKDEAGNAAEITAEIDETADRSNPANYTPVSAQSYYAFENPYSNGADWFTPGPDNKGHALRIEYNFDGGQTRTKEIYLPRVERNHYYTICCLIHNDGRIIITYNVDDWKEIPAYEINFEYPTYRNPLLPMNGEVLPEGQQYEQPTIWYDPTGSDPRANYTFQFEITDPVNLPWDPVLQYNGADETDYKLEVYQMIDGIKVVKDHNHSTEDTSDDCYASDHIFYITVIAKSARVNHEVGLGIAYTRRWNPDFGSSLLLINGLTSALRYKGSQYAEYVVIKQVDVPTSQSN